jgi:tetratricopeptide (TPR) repeat protein
MSYMLEIFGRTLPDSLWPVFRDYLNQAAPRTSNGASSRGARRRTTDALHTTSDIRGRPSSTGASRRTDCHVLAGVRALQQSSAGQAKLHFDRAISSRDRTAPAIIGMACALDMLGEAVRARRYVKFAMKRYPHDAKLHYAMGLLEERCGECDRAAALYKHSIYFQPHQKSSRFRLMALALAKADYQAARAQAETVAAQNPCELPHWTRLGGLQLLTDDPIRAIHSFEQALKLLADNWQSRPHRPRKHPRHGNLERAIQHLERKIAGGSNYADLHVRLGDLYNRQGRGDEALDEYKQALRVNPYYLEATAKVAASRILAGDHEEAAMWLGRAIEINESILMAYVGLALAHAYVGKEQASRSDLEMARGIAANAPVLMAEIVRLHAAATDAESARMYVADESGEARTLHKGELLRRSIQTHLAWLVTNQDDVAAWVRLGMLLEADRQPDHATEVYTKAVETYPGCTHALVRLGLAGTAAGGPAGAEASSLLRRAFWPENIDLATHYSLSILFSQAQRFEMTADRFSEGLAPDQNECFWRNVALTLEQMGMLNKPKCLWQSLTEISSVPQIVGGPPQGSSSGWPA